MCLVLLASLHKKRHHCFSSFFIPFISQHDDYFLYIVILEKKVWPRSSFGCPLSKKNVYLMRSSLSGNSRRSIKMCKSVYAALEVMVPSSFIDIDIFLHYEIPSCAFFSVQSIMFFFSRLTYYIFISARFQPFYVVFGCAVLKSTLEIFQ